LEDVMDEKLLFFVERLVKDENLKVFIQRAEQIKRHWNLKGSLKVCIQIIERNHIERLE